MFNERTGRQVEGRDALQEVEEQVIRINPGLRVARISETRIQVGSWPDCLVVGELSEADLRLVSVLGRGVSPAVLQHEAALSGVTPARTNELLEVLSSVLVEAAGQPPLAGLRADRLEPDACHWSAAYQSDGHSIVARRAQAAVTVSGLGRTGSTIAQALAAAGVGTIFLHDGHPVRGADVSPGAYRLTDIGMNRARATRRQIRTIDPTVQTHILSSGVGDAPQSTGFGNRVDVVVLLSRDTVSAALTAALMSRDQPHLPVVRRERDHLVGPLVIPGQSACSACIESPASPRTNTFAEYGPGAGMPDTADDPSATSADEVSQAAACAGLAAMQVLLYLDGRNQPSTWNSVLRLRSGDGLLTRHEAAPGTHCTCRLDHQGMPAA